MPGTSARRRRGPTTPLRHDGRDYLTTAQVCRMLGVKPQTVYAYVSRGQLTSGRIDGVRGSVFLVDDVEALTRRSVSRPPAGMVERIRTHITLIDDDHLYYRGQDATALTAACDFEQVTELLWDVRPERGPQLLPDRTFRQIEGLCRAQDRRIDVIRLVVDVLGSRDRFRHENASVDVAARTRDIYANTLRALPLLSDRPVRVNTFAAQLWPRLTHVPANSRRVRVLDAALVLLADHDLSAGTIAARVAASARGSIYSVISAGLGALDGTLHGGATTQAYRFLTAALDDPVGALASYTAAGLPVPGCGHVVYQHRDPRADALFELLESATGGDRAVLGALDGLRPQLARTVGGFMNSDMALAALALRYEMGPDAAETIFALARIAGWVAHALEEYQEPRLRFRPQGVYVGVRP
ncbi:citrate synthase [Williamsia limnetica]|uniref:citrate synthase (unknown stereospecificity) n=1 Tax=Williamsia limnetica TaxID=882452 RepID=A0A318RX15_WILLI|nr:citrate synthase [Williamsia limnetica]PYE17963.1 citrate synthase [Williamsia limnetica]